MIGPKRGLRRHRRLWARRPVRYEALEAHPNIPTIDDDHLDPDPDYDCAGDDKTS